MAYPNFLKNRGLTMLKNGKSIAILASLILLTGCANYQASTLSSLSGDSMIHAAENPNITAEWKVFDKKDCQTYLGRNLIAEGVIPVQMTIRNYSEDDLSISPDNFNIPIQSPAEVAKKVHTSTTGRAVGWGIGGLFVWPLFIPAIYDGIKSAQANRSLDSDYQSKALTEQTIKPYKTLNTLIFVPKEQMKQNIEMFLVNEKTHEKVVFSIF